MMLLNRAVLIIPRASIKEARVGLIGRLIGVLRITSFELLSAVTKLLHRGRRVKTANNSSII
jgi:hypothetical protein